MLFNKFFQIPARNISRSSVRAKLPSLGTLGKKDKLNIEENITLPVETNTQRLVEYVCGTNILSEGGEDIKVKPDSEYPEWLWSIRSPPPLEELSKDTKTFWNRVRRHREKEERYIRGLMRTSTVHK